MIHLIVSASKPTILILFCIGLNAASAAQEDYSDSIFDHFNASPQEFATNARDRERITLLGTFTGQFPIPISAHPEPTPERMAAAQQVLQCKPEDYLRAEYIEILTAEGRHWEQTGEAEALRELAHANDPQAQVDLALAYNQGLDDLGTEESERQMFRWLLAAANNGHIAAINEVGAAYVYGYYGENINLSEARRLLQYAEAHGDAVATYTLATLPPPDNFDLRIFTELRIDRELASAALCHDDASVAVAVRLLTHGAGLKYDEALAGAILDRVNGHLSNN